MGKTLTTLCFVLSAFWFVAYTKAVQDYDLQIQRIESNYSKSSDIIFDLRPIRNGLGKYAVNGSIITGLDIDNSCLATIKVYRSESGTSLYRLTPYAYPESPFYKFMNTIYCKILGEDLKSCSTFPPCKGTWDSPIRKGTYDFNKCDVTTDGMPGHLSPGVYKIEGKMTCKTVLYVTIYIKVDAKSII